VRSACHYHIDDMPKNIQVSPTRSQR